MKKKKKDIFPFLFFDLCGKVKNFGEEAMMTTTFCDLDASWQAALEKHIAEPQLKGLKEFLQSEWDSGHEIYPPKELIFSAFNYTPFDRVKVVIVGQDPYHGPGQAQGLCFSVQRGVRPPPSLINIFKEIGTDIGGFTTKHGCLTGWADQGVFLLNSILTVRRGQPASHQKKGWELFTDAALRALNERQKPCVFLLWGRYAQDKGQFLDQSRHLVLKAPHPSPFSAYNGFFGCRHFSKANRFLKQIEEEPIDWHAI